jgi:hypothetical protein
LRGIIGRPRARKDQSDALGGDCATKTAARTLAATESFLVATLDPEAPCAGHVRVLTFPGLTDPQNTYDGRVPGRSGSGWTACRKRWPAGPPPRHMSARRADARARIQK